MRQGYRRIDPDRQYGHGRRLPGNHRAAENIRPVKQKAVLCDDYDEPNFFEPQPQHRRQRWTEAGGQFRRPIKRSRYYDDDEEWDMDDADYDIEPPKRRRVVEKKI